MQQHEHKRRRGWALTVEGALVIALLGFWWLSPGRDAPRARWSVGASDRAPDAYATVPPETPLRLTLELPRANHVYVVSYDAVRGHIAMFPSAFLLSDVAAGPRPAGTTTLPGRHDGRDLQWHTGDAPGPIVIMVLVGDAPITELDRLLPRCRQMGNAAFVNRPVLGTYAPKGGMAKAPSTSRVHTDVLNAAFALAEGGQDGPLVPLPGHDGVHVNVLRLNIDAPASGDIRAQVEKSIGEQVRAAVEAARPKPGGR